MTPHRPAPQRHPEREARIHPHQPPQRQALLEAWGEALGRHHEVDRRGRGRGHCRIAQVGVPAFFGLVIVFYLMVAKPV
jgi:hypothetical protein